MGMRAPVALFGPQDDIVSVPATMQRPRFRQWPLVGRHQYPNGGMHGKGGGITVPDLPGLPVGGIIDAVGGILGGLFGGGSSRDSQRAYDAQVAEQARQSELARAQANVQAQQFATLNAQFAQAQESNTTKLLMAGIGATALIVTALVLTK